MRTRMRMHIPMELTLRMSVQMPTNMPRPQHSRMPKLMHTRTATRAQVHMQMYVHAHEDKHSHAVSVCKTDRLPGAIFMPAPHNVPQLLNDMRYICKAARLAHTSLRTCSAMHQT
jgi:hypothetical protein